VVKSQKRQRELALQKQRKKKTATTAGPAQQRYMRTTQPQACSAQRQSILRTDVGSTFNAD